MTTIQTLMHAPLTTVAPTDSVAQAARQMRDAGVGAALIMNGDALVGLFSERDLLNRVVAEGLDPSATTVEQVATREVHTVPVEAGLRRCAEVLRERGVRHLPVVEGTTPVGIVSARDFFEAIAGGFEGIIDNARYEEQLRENIDPYDHLGGSYGL